MMTFNINVLNEINETNKTKHIVVTEKTYRKIVELGKFGESFDDVLQRLLREGKTEEEIFGED